MNPGPARGSSEAEQVEGSVGRGVYRHSCPTCGSPNTEARLALGLPCEKCMPSAPSVEVGVEEVCRRLGGAARAGRLARICELEEAFREFTEYFESAVGSPPWGAQRTWARRLLRGDSFSIIAPTGVGKTTFGLVAALYLACRRGEKSYLVFPTTTLVEQALRKLESYLEGVKGCRPRILGIHSKMSVKAGREALKAFSRDEYDILVTTAAFMRRYAHGLAGKFRLVFVDDVDAVLRSGKSVDTLLSVVGFPLEALETAERLMYIERRELRLAERARRLQALIQQLRARAAVSREEAERRRQRIQELRRELEEVRAELDKLAGEALRLEEELEKHRRSVASLIVSSATGRPRGRRVRLFRILLHFEAGGRGDVGFRNVVDTYVYADGDKYEKAVEIVERLRDGVLVFVPIDEGIEGAERLAAMLRERGIQAEAYHAKKPLKILEDFAEGRIPVLVGVANYYGALVRGLDLPVRVKYAVFAGVPRHKFPADIGEPHPSRLMRLLAVLAEVEDDYISGEARRHMQRLRRILRTMSPAALQVITERVIQGDIGGEGSLTHIVWSAYKFLLEALRDDRVWRALSGKADVGVVEEDGKKYLLVPDPATYIQASGRTSRLYAGGITRGLSVVVVDDSRVFRGLAERTRWMADIEWRPLEEVDLERVKREIEEERRRVAEILRGKAGKAVDLVKTTLLIVESPNKARTIAGFFGRPSIRILPSGLRAYEVSTGDFILLVAASGGHVYDLATDEQPGDVPPSLSRAGVRNVFGVLVADDGDAYVPVYTSIKRCLDCSAQFTRESRTCPYCGSERIRDSRAVVEDLKRLAWEVDYVLVGTDPDTEGEKIGWDVALLLKPYSRRILRLEFHEVTRRAILEALRSLRSFDDRLVDAQIVRRVEDRWIGFTLSPLLWCDFWSRHYCPEVTGRSVEAGEASLKRESLADARACREYRYYYNLSAGRVQTPALGWVVEATERARRKIDQIILYHTSVTVTVNGGEEPLTVVVRAPPEDPSYREFMEVVAHARDAAKRGGTIEVRVEGEEWDVTVNPPPPYTTDALLADASRILGLGAPQTMRLAQDLFELGLITYHRTDSTRVSDKGIEVARTWLEQRFGEGYRDLFKPRRWGEGGAHEAIRPTRPIDAERLALLLEEGAIELARDITRRHLELYDLIFRRFMASQMAEARGRRARYTLHFEPFTFKYTVERLVELERDPPGAGFTLVWPYVRVEPRIPTGYTTWRPVVRKVKLSPPLTQGDLVALMKERGIGRPSTYAKIVDTLLRRRYIVVVGRRREYVVAALRGRMVYDYLTRRVARADEADYGPYARLLRGIPQLVSEERTRELEAAMDAIERGEKSRVEVLGEIYREIGGLAGLVLESWEGGAPGHEFTRRLSECLSRAWVYREVGEGASS